MKFGICVESLTCHYKKMGLDTDSDTDSDNEKETNKIFREEIVHSEHVMFENIELLILTHNEVGKFTVHADTDDNYPKKASMTIIISQTQKSSHIAGLYPIYESSYWERKNINSPGRFLLRYADLINRKYEVDVCFLQDVAYKKFCNNTDVFLKVLMLLAFGQGYYEHSGYLPYDIREYADNDMFESAYLNYPKKQKQLDIFRHMSVSNFFSRIPIYVPTEIHQNMFMMHYAQTVLDALFQNNVLVCQQITNIVNGIKNVFRDNNYIPPMFFIKSYLSSGKTLKRTRSMRFPTYTIDRIQAPTRRN